MKTHSFQDAPGASATHSACCWQFASAGVSLRAVVVGSLVVAACHSLPPQGSLDPDARVALQVSNLHAWSRLYGVLRWFHPSDAASAIDWNQLAIHGVKRALDAPDRQAFRSALTELIAPIAPTVRIASRDEMFVSDAMHKPVTAVRHEMVAWGHRGYGDDTFTGLYASKRRHRERIVPANLTPFASLWQAADAIPLRGKRVRLRGQLRTEKHGQGRLWMRVDRGDKRGFFDNMREHPVVSKTWVPAEIVGTVDSDATRIVFGMITAGGGNVWYDDIELAVEDTDGSWKRVPIADPGFESEDLFASWRSGTGGTSNTSLEGWVVASDRSHPARGTSSLRLETTTKIVSDELFDEAPEPGETIDVDLGNGLGARVPISLYSIDGRTIGDDPELALKTQKAVSATGTAFDPAAGIADVIVVWNVLQHFWPYWEVAPTDWSALLDLELAKAIHDRSSDEHLVTLQHLTAGAPDGHSNITCPGATPRANPPFAVDLVEGQIVITATSHPDLARGDVIIALNGRPAAEQLDADAKLVSGSRQWRTVRALQKFGSGAFGSILPVRVRRGTLTHELTVERGQSVAEDPSHPPIDRLDDGVYYVDLNRATMPEILAAMDRIAVAPGVVFDLRKYVRSSHEVLSYLLTQDIDMSAGMSIPHIIRPDHTSRSMPKWETEINTLNAHEPHIRGRVAFLTGPEAFSLAETVMLQVERHRLGAIVGSPTAGTNGNKAEIAAPTGCRVAFTPMRVTKADGSRFHLVGVLPTIPASRTIAGIMANRDEILEKGLAYVRGSY